MNDLIKWWLKKYGFRKIIEMLSKHSFATREWSRLTIKSIPLLNIEENIKC